MSDNLKMLADVGNIGNWVNVVLATISARRETERTYDYAWGNYRIRFTIEYTPHGPFPTIYQDPLP